MAPGWFKVKSGDFGPFIIIIYVVLSFFLSLFFIIDRSTVAGLLLQLVGHVLCTSGLQGLEDFLAPGGLGPPRALPGCPGALLGASWSALDGPEVAFCPKAKNRRLYSVFW